MTLWMAIKRYPVSTEKAGTSTSPGAVPDRKLHARLRHTSTGMTLFWERYSHLQNEHLNVPSGKSGCAWRALTYMKVSQPFSQLLYSDFTASWTTLSRDILGRSSLSLPILRTTSSTRLLPIARQQKACWYKWQQSSRIALRPLQLVRLTLLLTIDLAKARTGKILFLVSSGSRRICAIAPAA